MAKTIVINVKLFSDFACQKLSESASVLRSYSKNKSGTGFVRQDVFINFTPSLLVANVVLIYSWLLDSLFVCESEYLFQQE